MRRSTAPAQPASTVSLEAHVPGCRPSRTCERLSKPGSGRLVLCASLCGFLCVCECAQRASDVRAAAVVRVHARASRLPVEKVGGSGKFACSRTVCKVVRASFALGGGGGAHCFVLARTRFTCILRYGLHDHTRAHTRVCAYNCACSRCLIACACVRMLEIYDTHRVEGETEGERARVRPDNRCLCFRSRCACLCVENVYVCVAYCGGGAACSSERVILVTPTPRGGSVALSVCQARPAAVVHANTHANNRCRGVCVVCAVA